MKKILVVDDFQNVRKIIISILKKKDYQIIEAGNGKEALNVFNGQKIDMVITDLNMPDMDGIQLTEAIRSSSNYNTVPVLMVTTEVNQKKLDDAFSKGVTGILKKPFDVQRFVATIERALR